MLRCEKNLMICESVKFEGKYEMSMRRQFK